jgi:hypothetical protein
MLAVEGGCSGVLQVVFLPMLAVEEGCSGGLQVVILSYVGCGRGV